jgi:hypothetical protein
MDDQQKRLIMIGVFIGVTILLGYALYRVFFASAPPVVIVPPGQVTPPGTLPEAGPGSTSTRPGTGTTSPLPISPGTATPPALIGGGANDRPRVSQPSTDPALGARVDRTGAISFYNQTNGQFYRAIPGGGIVPMSDQVFYNVDSVTWAPTTNESVIEYPDGSNIYYNFDTKRQVTLPKEWTEFSFSPTGDKIAAKSIGYSVENTFLVTANPDGTSFTAIAPMGANADKVMVDWSPNRQIVALSRTGDQLGTDRQEVLFIGQNNENYPSTIVEGRGMRSQWSPAGNTLLYSVYSARSNYKPELWVVDGRIESLGQNRNALSINTWADKCTFADERFLYCGVPTTLETGSGLAPELAERTPDRLMRIDIQTGIQTEIALEGTHTIDTITINQSEGAVYFTDKTQSGIFRVDL